MPESESFIVTISKIPSESPLGCIFCLILGLLGIFILPFVLPLALFALWVYGIYRFLKCEGSLGKAIGVSMIAIGIVFIISFMILVLVLISQSQATHNNSQTYSPQQPYLPSTIHLKVSHEWKEVRLPYNSQFTLTTTNTIIVRMSDRTEFEATRSGDTFKYGRKVSSFSTFTIPLYIRTKNRNQKADVNFLPTLPK